MQAYQHVLFATDFTDEALQVGARAKEIAQRYGARLSLIHVIEPIVVSPGYDLLPVMPEVPNEVLQTSSQEALRRLARARLAAPEATLAELADAVGMTRSSAQRGLTRFEHLTADRSERPPGRKRRSPTRHSARDALVGAPR